MRTTVTTMRNEAPFILEWLSYHRVIGFTDFVVYSNDCEDGTDLMLDRLQDMGLVHHVPNPRRGKRPVQWTALKRAANHPAVKKAEWVFVTDVDEFLNIHTGDGKLDDLFAARPDADGFMISWRMFGANQQVRFQDGFITRQFTTAAPDRLLWPWRAIQFKSLFRNTDPGITLGVHRPKYPTDSALQKPVWIDDNGDHAHMVRGTVHLHQKPRYGLAQINHYALGSVESFLVKVARGKPNHSDDAIDLSYWLDRNLNEIADTSILRHDAETAKGVAELMSDPVISQLHHDGVAWRHAKIRALMRVSDSFYLYGRILQSSTTKPLPLDQQAQLLHQLFAMRRAQMDDQSGTA